MYIYIYIYFSSCIRMCGKDINFDGKKIDSERCNIFAGSLIYWYIFDK